MNRRDLLLGSVGAGALAMIGVPAQARVQNPFAMRTTYGHNLVSLPIEPIVLTDEQWRRRLTRAEYSILREYGTERRNTSDLLHEKRAGTFVCAGCELPLYRSENKYESGTGWPSFTEAIRGAIGASADNSLFVSRTEVHCARCLGHLGHALNDGPPPFGIRHCINGVALDFAPDVA